MRVLLSIFNHSNAEGREAYPGRDRMVEETGYCKSAVSAAVTNLKNRGWIIERERGSSVSGKTTVFDLVPDAPRLPGMSTGVDQHSQSSMSTGMHQLTEVGPVEWTGMSSGVDEVGPVEWTPTDPGTDPGSDYFLSDPVKDSVDTTASYGRSLAAGEEQSAEPTEGDPWVALYDTPTESDLSSVAPIAVPAGTALVHQPTTENEATPKRGACAVAPENDPWSAEFVPSGTRTTG